MPTYEYVCDKCGEQFVRIMSLKEYEAGQMIELAMSRNKNITEAEELIQIIYKMQAAEK